MENKVKEYVKTFGLDEELSLRFENLYLKEIEHFKDMKIKFDNLKKVKIFEKRILGFNFRNFNSEDFDYSSEDDLFNKAVSNVNKMFNKFLE